MTSKGRQRANERPFGQREYDVNLLRPVSEGKNYKYTILLPIWELYLESNDPPKAVFLSEDLQKLRLLLREDFRGVTYSKDIEHAMLQGEWIDEKGRTVINSHSRFEVYARINSTVVKYFAELKTRLHQYVKEVRNAEQEEILVERTISTFQAGAPLPSLRK
jgi:hypothetical protein